MFLALLDMDHLLLLALVPLSVWSLSLSPTFFAPLDFFSSLAYFTFSQSVCNPLSAGRPFIIMTTPLSLLLRAPFSQSFCVFDSRTSLLFL
ncbi:MAG: hypothetical protein J3R72DRAFT_462460, partial [Linnemannia gamsii]